VARGASSNPIKVIMSGNIPYYQWFILRQKELEIDCLTMMKELDGALLTMTSCGHAS
jgi:hypothetical protein